MTNSEIVIPLDVEEETKTNENIKNSNSVDSLKSNLENKNTYRSNCCNNRSSVDKRLLGFISQLTVSSVVLIFSIRQISVAEKDDDLTIYYALISGIIGNFTPTFYSQKQN